MAPNDPPEVSAEEIALGYLEQLPWPPYPFQEQAILTWFDCEDGLLVCAPTGTGKTVIAETALYEALKTGRRAYYTTPLIALTEQKFHELQEAAERWGFSREHVGLVTGNRRVNPDAPILVVVAEILLNRLLSVEEFPFDDVSAVVMDEFHSFNDPERGIVWELSLGMLPRHTRVLLISATVGNAPEFVSWLNRQHDRKLRLLQSETRRVPLTFHWIPDQLLTEQLEFMASGDEKSRYTPALVFCFNRSECWNVAEQLKGRALLADGQQKALQKELERMDWSVGAGGKLKQLLIRGVGIHHAGLLPRYRRAVETLFQKKLLSVCVCTETLAAGINLPARSVVMTSLLKGPPKAKKLIDPASAQQMFGRAGRPQFDDHGHVFAIAHEDDVRLFRWQRKYDQIPEDTKDPLLIKAKKNLKKKMPRRRPGQQYWSEKQFEQLRTASPARLTSRGRLPWRLLAFWIRKSGSVELLRDTVRRRLLDADDKEDSERSLKSMLLTLNAAGLIELSPPPPGIQNEEEPDSVFHSRAVGTGVELEIDKVQHGRTPRTSVWKPASERDQTTDSEVVDFTAARDDDDAFGIGIFGDESSADQTAAEEAPFDSSQQPARSNDSAEDQPPEEQVRGSAAPGLLGQLIQEARDSGGTASTRQAPATNAPRSGDVRKKSGPWSAAMSDEYLPQYAIASKQLEMMFAFRSINPLYALFIAEHLHKANYEERLQLLESTLQMPRSVRKSVRVPLPDVMPPGPLATTFADQALLTRGLVTQDDLTGYRDEETGRRIPPLPLAEKMLMLFRDEFPSVHDVRITAVWCVGDLLQFGGHFDRFVRARDLTKQEGIIFRHCLRMILLCGEYAQIEPPGIDPEQWRKDLAELAAILTDACRAVDPSSTDETLHALETRKLDPDQLLL